MSELKKALFELSLEVFVNRGISFKEMVVEYGLSRCLEELDWIATDREFQAFWREYGENLESHQDLLSKVEGRLKHLGIYPWVMAK